MSTPNFTEKTEISVDITLEYRYNVKANENASVAQSVVHLTRNEKVACSSQVTSSITLPVLANYKTEVSERKPPFYITLQAKEANGFIAFLDVFVSVENMHVLQGIKPLATL